MNHDIRRTTRPPLGDGCIVYQLERRCRTNPWGERNDANRKRGPLYLEVPKVVDSCSVNAGNEAAARHAISFARAFWLLFLISTTACGTSSSPSTASAAPPVQVGGTWNIATTLTTTSGGECTAPIFQSIVGFDLHGSITFTQRGSALTATTSSSKQCPFTGTASQTGMSLSATSCEAGDVLGLRCANGALRDIRFISSTLTMTVTGNTAQGTEVDTYNIVVSGTQTSVGTVTNTETIYITR
jgi:hypothetical protein